MKLVLWGLFVALIPLSGSAQQAKGVKPLVKKTTDFSGTTRAVVVGISDYKSIEDLDFAHKDAIEFAKFLNSKSGGNADTANIKLLLNEEGNLFDIIMKLDWLVTSSQPGDRAIVYFSGHGDVETKTDAKTGYLLAYNTPKNVYAAGGLNVAIVQNYLNTMSSNDVQVTFYADACRSGNLAGGVNGATLTNEALQKQVQNQVKILSCQSGELSLESEAWGGGRGVFSYHLIRGLVGLADGNSDGSVKLLELSQHLQQTVPPEVEPQSQIPLVNGNLGMVVAYVDEPSLAQLKDGSDKPEILMASVKGKGSTELAGNLPPNIKEQYDLFQQYLLDENLWGEDENNAYTIFSGFAKEDIPGELYNIMKRNLAAALQNSAQKVINQYVNGELAAMKTSDGGNYLFSSPVREQRTFFNNAALEMGLSRDVLGRDHVLDPYIKARQLFLEARATVGSVHDEELEAALEKLHESLEIEPEAAYAFNTLGIIKYALKEYDAAIPYFEKALQLAPTWASPLANIGNTQNALENYEGALDYFKKTLDLDPQYFYVYSDMGVTNSWLGNTEEAISLLNASLEYDADNAITWNDLGAVLHKSGDKEGAEEAYGRSLQLDPGFDIANNNMGLLLFELGEYESAGAYLTKAIELNPTYAKAYFNHANNQFAKTDLEGAIDNYLKCLEITPLDEGALFNLAGAYYDMGDFSGAIEQYQALLDIYPNYANGYYNIACAYSLDGNVEESLKWLEQAFSKGYNKKASIESEADLNAIRSHPRYEELLEEYFSE